MTITTKKTFKIIGYTPQIDPAWRQKLLSIGMLPGAYIDVIRVAPMGDPIQIRTQRLNIAVRQKDLSTILLEEITA